jgi:hypothetical protein
MWCNFGEVGNHASKDQEEVKEIEEDCNERMAEQQE